jgi:hypothetical protein
MKLRESHSSLPPEQQQFLRDKRVESTWTPVQWLGFLGSLADWDARADATRGKTGRKLWMTILFGILVVVAVSIVLSPIDGAVLAVILVVAVVVLTRAWRSARKLDLPGEQLRFAATIVTVLAEDVAPATGLYLKLDLRGATDDSKKTEVTPQYRRGVYHKVVDTFYVDPWFTGSAALVDDANLYWHVVDRTRSSKRTKRNPRGKIKTKTKVKKTTFLQVGLQLPAKNYAVHQQGEAVTPDGAGGATKVKVKPAESRANIKLTRTMKSAGAKGLADPQELIALIADAYGRGDPARRKKI